MSKICFLIHGYLTDYRDFKSLLLEIMKDYDQVILYQLPGHNHKCSLKLFTKGNTFKSIDDEMKKIILNNTVDVIGFSLGGALAWHIALNYPIQKLVLMSPAIRYFNPAFLSSKINYQKGLETKDKQVLKNNDKEAISFVMHNTFPKFTLKNGVIFCTIVNAIYKEEGNVNVPTLIIRGTLDELVPEKVISEISHRCTNPHIEIFKVPGIGHMMLRTQKEKQIVDKIKNFLEEKDNE